MILHRVKLPILILLTTFSLRRAPLASLQLSSKTIHSPEEADVYVRWGGTGKVVVLLRGYAKKSDSWAPLAADLMKDHTVVVPDLRGIGKSSKPKEGYDKKTEPIDIRAAVTALGFDKTSVVAHDIGNMVAYAYAAMYPDKVDRLVVMDAPIPGIEPWNAILLNPGVWHFNFRGPDAERLVAGRERIYFHPIWNDFTGDPAVVPGSGHWLMEERPSYTVNLVRRFLDSPAVVPVRTMDSNVGETRLTPAEFKFPQQGNPETGRSGVSGIQTIVLKGGPNEAASSRTCSVCLRTHRLRRTRTAMIVSRRLFQEPGG